MTTCRLVLHALDRTGPPMLARALLRWLRTNEPTHEMDVVALRGGELLDDFVDLAPTRIMLDPDEPWDPWNPTRARSDQLQRSLRDLPSAGVTLLVSISAGAVLPLLPHADDTVVTWVVEQHERFPPELTSRTVRWLAGSEGTRDELRERIGRGPRIELAPEFIEEVTPISEGLGARWRVTLGAADTTLLVLGAGIATARKAPDLFLEVAVAHRRSGHRSAFVWVGGRSDPLFSRVQEEARRLSMEDFRMFPGVAGLDRCLGAADVFVHPARFDAFPLVCLHAASAGTPVVAFAGAGGVPEMFGTEFLGSQYPDVTALASIVESLRDPLARQQIGQAQQRRVRERFTADRCAPVVLEHLLEVAG